MTSSMTAFMLLYVLPLGLVVRFSGGFRFRVDNVDEAVQALQHASTENMMLTDLIKENPSLEAFQTLLVQMCITSKSRHFMEMRNFSRLVRMAKSKDKRFQQLLNKSFWGVTNMDENVLGCKKSGKGSFVECLATANKSKLLRARNLYKMLSTIPYEIQTGTYAILTYDKKKYMDIDAANDIAKLRWVEHGYNENMGAMTADDIPVNMGWNLAAVTQSNFSDHVFPVFTLTHTKTNKAMCLDTKKGGITFSCVPAGATRWKYDREHDGSTVGFLNTKAGENGGEWWLEADTDWTTFSAKAEHWWSPHKYFGGLAAGGRQHAHRWELRPLASVLAQFRYDILVYAIDVLMQYSTDSVRKECELTYTDDEEADHQAILEGLQKSTDCNKTDVEHFKLWAAARERVTSFEACTYSKRDIKENLEIYYTTRDYAAAAGEITESVKHTVTHALSKNLGMGFDDWVQVNDDKGIAKRLHDDLGSLSSTKLCNRKYSLYTGPAVTRHHLCGTFGCPRLHKYGKILKRVSDGLRDDNCNGNSLDPWSTCSTNHQRLCMEGSQCAWQHRDRAKWIQLTALVVGTVGSTFVTSGILGAASMAFAAGNTMSGAALTTAGGLWAAVPDPLIGAAVSAVLSKEWLRTCGCTPMQCVEQEGECFMEQIGDGKHSNPFALLPPSNFKCAKAFSARKASSSTVSASTVNCELQTCTSEDFKHIHEPSKLYGKVGRHSPGVYNCPSVDGTNKGSLMNQDKLNGHEHNTSSRVKFLEQYKINGTELLMGKSGVVLRQW